MSDKFSVVSIDSNQLNDIEIRGTFDTMEEARLCVRDNFLSKLQDCGYTDHEAEILRKEYDIGDLDGKKEFGGNDERRWVGDPREGSNYATFEIFPASKYMILGNIANEEITVEGTADTIQEAKDKFYDITAKELQETELYDAEKVAEICKAAKNGLYEDEYVFATSEYVQISGEATVSGDKLTLCMLENKDLIRERAKSVSKKAPDIER